MGLGDKKAHGVDGLPAQYLKKIGTQKAYKLFCDWTNLRLTEEENLIMSTARLIFLSKTKKEIIEDPSEYRCIAI